MAHGLLIIFVLFDRITAQKFFFLRVIAVISFKNGRFAVVEFDYFVCDTVKKIAVMRYDQDTSLVVGKIRFQPLDRSEVKVVGRLVEDQQIRLKEKEFSECYTGFLSAGKSIDRFVNIISDKAKSVDDSHNLAFACVAVFCLKFSLHAVIALQKGI